jgi:RNA polymerase sigma factor (sigma-70 family)
MPTGNTDDLMTRLSAGDRTAAEWFFRKYEPFLRMIVRRQLTDTMRVKFDSSDIVQSAFADVWDGLRRGKWTFHHADQFKAFLVKVTRNRLVDCLRRNRNKLANECPLLESEPASIDSSGSDSAIDILSAKELWERILAACPEDRRDIVLLKGQGLSSVEIASRVGMHESSVRRILDDVRRRLGLKRVRRS